MLWYRIEFPEELMPEEVDSYCADLVRKYDSDRYLLTMMAPVSRRAALLAVYAFNVEIVRIRESVSESMLGAIRLQWWRDAIDALYSGRGPAHAVIRPLGEAVERHGLSQDLFHRVIDGRAADLDSTQPATLDGLVAYADETSTPLILLALEITGQREDLSAVASDAGVAWALTGLVRAIPFHLRNGWNCLPVDACARHGFAVQDLPAAAAQEKLSRVVCDISEYTGQRIAAARSARGRLTRAGLPALLPVSFAAAYQRRLERVGFNPYDARMAGPPPMIAWRLLLRLLSGRY